MDMEWYYCPNCRKKLFRYGKGAKCSGLFVWCRGCKREFEITI